MSAGNEEPVPEPRLKERLYDVFARLRLVHPEPSGRADQEPLDTLVATILSQNTSNVNSSRAFDSLKQRFPDWEDVLTGCPGEVEDAIRTGGLARQKAPRILGILHTVRAQRGDLSLKFLREMDNREAYGWLSSLPGVGPKTAACVLLFSLQRAAFPVDTHVERVLKRLELFGQNMAPGEMQEQIQQAVDDSAQALRGHLLLVRHGRSICLARSPRCSMCPLLEICPAGQERLKSVTSSPPAVSGEIKHNRITTRQQDA